MAINHLCGLPSSPACGLQVGQPALETVMRRLIQTIPTVARPNREPTSEAVKMVKIVSFIPRKTPIIAISLTSPEAMPSMPRQRKYTAPAP